jgi:hypothetical protein
MMEYWPRMHLRPRCSMETLLQGNIPTSPGVYANYSNAGAIHYRDWYELLVEAGTRAPAKVRSQSS